jgi:hypothetical protein
MSEGPVPGKKPAVLPSVEMRVVKPEGVPEVFFEGVAQVSVGPSVAKMDFYTSDPIFNQDGSIIEVRNIKQTVVIPTIALYQFIASSLEGAVSNRGILEAALSASFDEVAETTKRAAGKA